MTSTNPESESEATTTMEDQLYGTFPNQHIQLHAIENIENGDMTDSLLQAMSDVKKQGDDLTYLHPSIPPAASTGTENDDMNNYDLNANTPIAQAQPLQQQQQQQQPQLQNSAAANVIVGTISKREKQKYFGICMSVGIACFIAMCFLSPANKTRNFAVALFLVVYWMIILSIKYKQNMFMIV